MTDRDIYVQQMKARLDEWNAMLDKFQARGEKTKAEAMLEYKKQMEVINKRRAETLQKLSDIQTASEDAWNDLRIGMDDAWKRMNDAYKEAASRFK